MLPLLYLHGLSTSDFAPALTQFLGIFNQRQLAEVDYVYVWVDGIHLKVRLEQDKVCLLVMIGVRSDRSKELVALADGFHESSESWADLLGDCKRRGMRAPCSPSGRGAGVLEGDPRRVPDTREQRCWWHKIGNVLAALPKSAHPGAKKAMAEIYNAEKQFCKQRRSHGDGDRGDRADRVGGAGRAARAAGIG